MSEQSCGYDCSRCGKRFAERHLLHKHVSKTKTLCKPKVADITREEMIRDLELAYPLPVRKTRPPPQEAAEPPQVEEEEASTGAGCPGDTDVAAADITREDVTRDLELVSKTPQERSAAIEEEAASTGAAGCPADSEAASTGAGADDITREDVTRDLELVGKTPQEPSAAIEEEAASTGAASCPADSEVASTGAGADAITREDVIRDFELVRKTPQEPSAAQEEPPQEAASTGFLGDGASRSKDAAMQTEDAIYSAHLRNANRAYSLDANAQRFAIAKLHLLEVKLDRLQQQLAGGPAPAAAAAAAADQAPPVSAEQCVLRARLCHGMLTDFMRSHSDWTWWALSDALKDLKTTSDDRPLVLVVLFLRVVSTMLPEEEVLLGAVPRCLPPGFPKSLERSLAQLLQELRQPYRKIRFFADEPVAWHTVQLGLCFLQQQLLGVASGPELEVSYEQAMHGLDMLVNETVGAAQAWQDFANALLKRRAADALRFAESWPGASHSVAAQAWVTGFVSMGY